MTAHTLAEAEKNLSDLVARARKGEDVIITVDGQPVASINGLPQPAPPEPKRMTREAVEWLIRNRVGGKIPEEDAGTFVSRMRDEEWDR